MINSPFVLLIFSLAIRMRTVALIINPSETHIVTTTSPDNFYSNPIEESSQFTKQHLDMISGLAPKENQKALQAVFISKLLRPSIWESPVWIYHSPISSRKYSHQNDAKLPQKFSSALQKRDNSPNDQTDTTKTLDENVVAKSAKTLPDQLEATQDVNATLTSGQSDIPTQNTSQDSEVASPVNMDATSAELSTSAVDSSEKNHESSEIQTSLEISTPEIPSSISKDSTKSEPDSSETVPPESGAVMNEYSQNLATETAVETVPQTSKTSASVLSDTPTTTTQSSTAEAKSLIAKESTILSPESGVVIEKFPNTAKDTSDVSKSEVTSTRTKLGNLQPASSSSSVPIGNETTKTEEPCETCGSIKDADTLTGNTIISSKSTKIPSKAKEVPQKITSGETPSISSGDPPSKSSSDAPSISSGDLISVSSGELPITSNGTSSTVNDHKNSKKDFDGVGYLSPKEKLSTIPGEEKKSSSKDSKLGQENGNNGEKNNHLLESNNKDAKVSPEDSKGGQTIKNGNDLNKSKEEKDKKERQSRALSIGIFSGLAGGLACTIFLAMII